MTEHLTIKDYQYTAESPFPDHPGTVTFPFMDLPTFRAWENIRREQGERDNGELPPFAFVVTVNDDGIEDSSPVFYNGVEVTLRIATLNLENINPAWLEDKTGQLIPLVLATWLNDLAGEWIDKCTKFREYRRPNLASGTPNGAGQTELAGEEDNTSDMGADVGEALSEMEPSAA